MTDKPWCVRNGDRFDISVSFYRKIVISTLVLGMFYGAIMGVLFS